MADDSRGEVVDRAEAGEVGETAPTPAIPKRLRDLEHEERAQEISLRRLFAEQEHGLRQKYADWIIWLLGAQFVIADGVFVVFA